MMDPLTPDQVPLPPRVRTSNGNTATLSGRSACASRSQQARDNLTHLLSIYSLTGSPPLVKAVVIRLSTTSRPHTAKRAELDSLLLPDGSAPSPDEIEDLLSLA